MTDHFAAPAFATVRRAMIAVAAVAMLTAFAPHSPAAADAFRNLSGGWSGGGSAIFSNGQRERLRCSANYSGAGQRLGIHVRCASASAQINLSGALQRSGRRVSGGWSESNFGLGGTAFGSANANGIRLRIRGSLDGYLTLGVSGRSHSLAMSSRGTALSGVNVRMRRR